MAFMVHRIAPMPIELASLLRRDHHDLASGLMELAQPLLSKRELCTALDGVRLGMIAHSEAQDIVLSVALSSIPDTSRLHLVVAHERAEHIVQERALSALVVTQPCTVVWRERADQLRALVLEHARYEEQVMIPALRNETPRGLYASLAGRFATERLRQLAMLQPSAPIAAYSELAAM